MIERRNDDAGPSGRMATRRELALGALGASVVSVLGGVVLGRSATRRHDEAYRLCSDPSRPCVDADRSNAMLASSNSRALAADIAFGVAAVAAAGAAVLWFTGTSDLAPTRRVCASPSVGSGKLGLAVVGRF